MTNLERSQSVWSVKDVIQWTSKRFHSMGMETPLLDAQLIVGFVLELDKVQLYMHYERPLSADERASIRGLVQRRLQGEPVAYLLGKKHWHTLELIVDKRVLIPRPETETLLDFVLLCWEKNELSPRIIVDFCTGSGCLAIALAKKFSAAKVIAVDCSQDALEVARENATKNGVDGIEFMQADVFDPLLLKSIVKKFGTVDILVANPPYVSEAEWQSCSPTVKDFEPRIALISDCDGLAHAEAILRSCCESVMSENSVFAMEMGIDAPLSLVRTGAAGDCNDFATYSFHTPVWDIPRSRWFALRDLEARARFLCRVLGMERRHFEPVSNGDTCFDESHFTLSDEL